MGLSLNDKKGPYPGAESIWNLRQQMVFALLEVPQPFELQLVPLAEKSDELRDVTIQVRLG